MGKNKKSGWHGDIMVSTCFRLPDEEEPADEVFLRQVEEASQLQTGCGSHGGPEPPWYLPEGQNDKAQEI